MRLLKTRSGNYTACSLLPVQCTTPEVEILDQEIFDTSADEYSILSSTTLILKFKCYERNRVDYKVGFNTIMVIIILRHGLYLDK